MERFLMLTPYHFAVSCALAGWGYAFPAFWAEVVRSLSVIIAATAAVVFYSHPQEYFGNISRTLARQCGRSWPPRLTLAVVLAGEVVVHWVPLVANGPPKVVECLFARAAATSGGCLAPRLVHPFVTATGLGLAWFFCLRRRLFEAYGPTVSDRKPLAYAWVAFVALVATALLVGSAKFS